MSNLVVDCDKCSAPFCIIYFNSGRSCSYSSVGPPGDGCCTVCSHLAPVEVRFLLTIIVCHQK